MFRKMKKKPTLAAPKRSLETAAEEEQEDTATSIAVANPADPSPGEGGPREDPPGLVWQRNKNKASRRPKGLRAGTGGNAASALAAETHNDDGRTTVRVTKRPRAAGGMGYGGAAPAPLYEEDDNAGDTSGQDSTANRYDTNALSQLRQEQQSRVVPQSGDGGGGGTTRGRMPGRNPNENPGDAFPIDPTPNSSSNNNNNDQDDIFGMGRNFIPIDASAESIRETVLAGDAALAYTENPNAGVPGDETQASASRTMNSVLTGMGASDYVPPTNNNEYGQGNAMSSSASNLSLTLDDVHQQFSRTQERLQQQAEELEKSLKRRHEATEEAREQVNKHSQELKTTGSSLEFYQAWRRDLISFVGALREITKALPDMQNAWHELEQDMAGMEKWKDWEDDTFSVLSRYKLVQSVVGRQPLLASDVLGDDSSSAPSVDEFGRDVVSQKQRILQQRRAERQRIRKEAVLESGGVKSKMGTESSSDGSVSPHLNSNYAYPTGYPVLVGPSEMESFRERNTALQHALKVLLDGLYEEYTSLPQLFELFAQWKRSFPAEYQECYASLTLADLATVLILVELLSLNDPLNESGGHDEAKWIATVCRYYNGDDVVGGDLPQGGEVSVVQLFDKESIERLVSKAVLPTLQDLLTEKRTYNLLSGRQSKALSAFFSNAYRLLPQDHPVLRLLHKVIVDYIDQSLQDLSIPLIVQQNVALECLAQIDDSEEKELLGQTIHDATIGQIERVKKIMLNLFDCWATILPVDCGLPAVILQFMSSKVVPLLSTLQTWYWPSLAESPVDVFLQLWQEVQKYDWLDRPENMIHSTVLKATAEAFRVDPVTKSADVALDDLASDPIIQEAN